MARVTHIRRVFDDGVISSTDYDNSQDAIDDGVFSAMGAQETGLTYTDPDTGYTSNSTGSSYIDIEVADQITLNRGSGFQSQVITRTFLWGDSWASDDQSWGDAANNGARKILNDLIGSKLLDKNRQIFVKMVLLDPNDNTSAVPVPIISSVNVTGASGYQWQGSVHTLDNTSTAVQNTRLVTPTRIVNYDSASRATDKSQFVDESVIDAMSRTSAIGFKWQRTVLSPDNVAYYNSTNIMTVPSDAVVGSNGVDPPWMLDPLQRFVNVNMGGGIFVGGPVAAGLSTVSSPAPDSSLAPVPGLGAYYAEIRSKTKKQNWKIITIVPGLVGDQGELTGNFSGSSYTKVMSTDSDGNQKGKPVFILAGAVRFPDYFDLFGLLILYSNDGLTWKIAHKEPPDNADFVTVESLFFGTTDIIPVESQKTCNAVTWNSTNKKFYISVRNQVGTVTDPGPPSGAFFITIYDEVYASSDGLSWSKIESQPIIFDGNNKYADPLFPKYCNNRVLDKNGLAQPDGIYGYDEKKDILITPEFMPWQNYAQGGIDQDFYFPDPITKPGQKPYASSTVRIKEKDESFSVDTGIDQIWSVAFAGGVWIAAGSKKPNPDGTGGGGKIASSIDDGDTWTVVNENDQSIRTMCAGPSADIPRKKSDQTNGGLGG